MTATSSTAELERFLATFRESQIVEEGQFGRVVARLPSSVTGPREAATAFVDTGVLTRFQADRLLSGRSDGFLLGPFVILEPLGKGVSSRVYKARHRTMSRYVAVKVLDPTKTSKPGDRDAVLAEAKAAARLSHMNLVGVQDINRLKDRIFFVLDYVDGVTVDAVVKRSGPLPVGRACDIGRQAAAGLAYAHGKGLSHGGVNPGNLMVGRSSGSNDREVARWLNVGMARLRVLAGTGPDGETYRGPEAEASPTQDAYGLGATLYLLLTGQPPVPYHKRGVTSEPLPVENVRPDAPPPLVALVNRLLSSDPSQRPTLAEAAESLEPFGQATSAYASVDFDVTPTKSSTLGPASSLLSGLIGPAIRVVDNSPWNDIDGQASVPTLDAAVVTTPVQTPAPKPRVPAATPALPVATPARPATRGAYLPYAVAGGAIVGTLALAGVVLRWATK